MLEYLKHDPYAAPYHYKKNLTHLDVECVLCGVSESTADWPASFDALRGKQLLVDDYMLESVEHG
jgi:hypothetical protein